MTCCQKTVIIFAMSFVKDSVCLNFQVIPILLYKMYNFIQHYFMVKDYITILYNNMLTGWVNRFANAGDTAVEIAENTAFRVSSFKLLYILNHKNDQNNQFFNIYYKIITYSFITNLFSRSLVLYSYLLLSFL